MMFRLMMCRSSIDWLLWDRSKRKRAQINSSRRITGREGWLAPASSDLNVIKGLSSSQAGPRHPSRPVIRATNKAPAITVVGAIAICMMSLIVPRVYAQQTVDQILTLVNDDVITRIDLLWSIAMDPQAPSPVGPVGSDLLSRKLDVMIDERLITQEAIRVPSNEITQDEIDKKKTELIKSFQSEAQFRERVGSVGLTPQKIEELIRQRIVIDRFVEFRFRSFVLITEQDIKRFYDEVLAPAIRNRGAVPPSLDDIQDGKSVREGISATLKQRKINDEVERWLSQARQRADIVQLAEP